MTKYFRLFLSLALVLFLSGTPSFAQFGSNVASVNLSMNIGESLTVSATPANISFTYGSGSATASGPISVTTTWNLSANRILVTDAYFTSTTALTGPTNVPTSSVTASIDGSSAQPCSGSDNSNPNSVAGATCPRVFQAVPTASMSGTNTDTVLLALTGLSGNPGVYAGTLNISAYVN